VSAQKGLFAAPRPAMSAQDALRAEVAARTIDYYLNERPSHMDRAGLRRLGDPKNFLFFAWEALGNHDDPPARRLIKMTGCVVTRTKKRGHDAGTPAYDGERVVTYINEADIEAERVRFEAEVGCHACYATGQESRGWNHITGTQREACRRCAGSGKAPVA
jgi:hypothetical protein